MTGQGNGAEAFFEEIEAKEALTEEFRNALQRKKAAEWYAKSPVSRALETFRRKAVRKIEQKIGRPVGRKKNSPPSPVIAEGDLALDRGSAEERRSLYIRKERIAVYSALFGTYDLIREPYLVPDNIDYFLITDQERSGQSRWQYLDPSAVPEQYRGDPVLASRWCKMHPHLLFPDYEYSIYLDANIWVFSDLTPVTAGLDRFPAAMFRHKNRRCVYEEVQACLDQKKDRPAALKAHRKLLRAHGVPEKWGLLEASVIARKHKDPRCISLMEDWWQAFLKNSRRDQISLIDCLYLGGIEPYTIGTLGDHLQKCRLFLQMPHPEESETGKIKNAEELSAWMFSVK